jgi:hypothetical protein
MREASFTAGPSDSLHVIDVESRVPLALRVTMAEEGSLR